MIADIDNPDFLEALHDLLAARKQHTGEFWKRLSSKEKDEVLEAYHQSNDPDKLTEHKEVLKRYL